MLFIEKMTFRAVFSVLVFCSTFAVCAADRRVESKKNKPVFPAPIAAMLSEGKGVKFQDKFDAPGGLQGYVLSAANGERRIYYVTPDGKHAILGIFLDENLNNLTAEHQKTYMNVLEFLGTTRVDPAKMVGSAFDMSMRSPYAFVEGKGADLFVVFDSECTPCARLHKETRGYLDRIRIHWIPVALVNEKSAKWMAVFLQAREKSAVLTAMFAGQEPPSVTSPQSLQDAQENAREIIKNTGSTTLPLSFFMDITNAERTVAGPLTKNQLDGIAKITQAIGERSSMKNP